MKKKSLQSFKIRSDDIFGGNKTKIQPKKYDVFISHASEDKQKFVRPLAQILKNIGAKVWFDEFELKVGDSLSRSIDKGLACSRYGIVVLSKHFLKKDWPETELKALLAKEYQGNKVILPIWHKISREDLLKYSPILADKIALSTDRFSIEKIAAKIIEIINPEFFQYVVRKMAFEKMVQNSKTVLVKRVELKISKVRHKQLSKSLIKRAKLIRVALLPVLNVPLKRWITDFKRDIYPEDEIAVWERIAHLYLEITNTVPESKGREKDIFIFLLHLSSGSDNAAENFVKNNPVALVERISKILISNSIKNE